ncbi:MAG: glycosyltransferase [Gammaproteobacteria bacterium]
MSRSLHIIGSKRPGGAEGFYVRLLQALNESRHEAMAVCPPQSAVAHLLGDSAKQKHIKMRSHWDPVARYRLSRFISEAHPDIVMTYLGRATRLVHLPVGKQPVHIARLGGYYDIRQYVHAHAWVGNTKGICDYLVSSGLPAARVTYIPNFIDQAQPAREDSITAAREELTLPAQAKVVLALGRLHQVKGFDTLLRAFATLHANNKNTDVYLVILGEGSERHSLEGLACELRIDPFLRMPGWRDSLAAYFALAEVFVCPSRLEPFGNVILDAWSHGVPLVATRTAGAAELVTDQVDGVLVPVDDVAAMAVEIDRIRNASNSERFSFVEAGRKTLEQRFSRAAVVGAYLSLFDQLILQ